MKLTEYALYKGDKFIDVGTIRELAKRTGINPNTLKYIAAPIHHKRVSGREIENDTLIAYKLESEDNTND